MNILGMTSSGIAGIFGALQEDNGNRQKTELVAAYTGGERFKARQRQTTSSDTVVISDTALALAAGALNMGVAGFNGGEAVDFQQYRTSVLGQEPDNNAREYTGYRPLIHARASARRAGDAVSAAGVSILAQRLPGENTTEATTLTGNNAAVPTGLEAVFTVTELQGQMRELQRELAALENSTLPDAGRLSEIQRLSGSITRIMREVDALLQGNRG